MSKMLYRITFIHHDEIYEIYAKNILESEIFSFLEVEDIVFGEHTNMVVDPSEERLRHEFQDVQRTYIPTHTIIRIDRVKRQGKAKVKDLKTQQSNISPFPRTSRKTEQGGE